MGSIARLRLRVVPGDGRAGIVSIVSGPSRREKIIELAGITQAELETRLTSAEGKDSGP